jgi:DNA-binding response OmpR family regulator
MFATEPTSMNSKLPRAEAGPVAHILAIDDDPSIRHLVTAYLGDHGFRVTAIAGGNEIAEIMSRDTVDLIVLDLKLRGEDGMEIARRLRSESSIPIIMLTARQEEVDRIMGLELGADDYLTKPFSTRELLARIRALLRRTRSQETIADGLARLRAYRFFGWELSVRTRRLKTPAGEVLALTNSEFNLLVCFLASPKRVLSREQLLDLSRLHNDEVYDRSIDVQVARLRRKLKAHGAPEDLICTERGAGYTFIAPVEVVR